MYSERRAKPHVPSNVGAFCQSTHTSIHMSILSIAKQLNQLGRDSKEWSLSNKIKVGHKTDGLRTLGRTNTLKELISRQKTWLQRGNNHNFLLNNIKGQKVFVLINYETYFIANNRRFFEDIVYKKIYNEFLFSYYYFFQ